MSEESSSDEDDHSSSEEEQKIESVRQEFANGVDDNTDMGLTGSNAGKTHVARALCVRLRKIASKVATGDKKTLALLAAVDDQQLLSDTLVGEDVPNTDEMRLLCKDAIEKLKLTRDRSLKVPSSRAQMLKSEKEMVNLYLLAEKAELQSLEKLDVFEVVDRPYGRNVMKGRWVYDNKYDDQGVMKKAKARFVAKGFSQVYGQDYTETFSPTAHFKTFKTLLALSAGKPKSDVRLWDVSTAFLNAPAETEMFCEMPEGYRQNGKVLKLLKTLYGTKQAGRNWYLLFTNVLKKIGFVQSRADNCLFILKKGGETFWMLVHVDDMAVFTTGDSKLAVEVLQKLRQHFDVKDEGKMGMFLGVRVLRNVDGSFSLCQQHYIETLAERFEQLGDYSGVKLPYNSTVRLTSDMLPQTEAERKEALKLPYQELMGALNYLLITRPEIAFNQSQLAKFMGGWGMRHWKAGLQQLRWLINTKERALVIRPIHNPVLISYADSDLFGDKDPGCAMVGASHGGHAVFLQEKGEDKRSLVFSRSKKHSMVTLSSTGSEIVEAVNLAKEVIYFRHLLGELGYPQDEPSVIMEDNNGCISFAKNGTHHQATKHIALRFYWLRERVASNEIVFEKVGTHDNTADIFTKPLARIPFEKHAQSLLNAKHGMSIGLNYVLLARARSCSVWQASY